MHYKKAQIQAKLGNKKEATASAQKAIDILKKDKTPDESAIKNAQQIIDRLEVRINSDVADPTWRCRLSPGLTRNRADGNLRDRRDSPRGRMNWEDHESKR